MSKFTDNKHEICAKCEGWHWEDWIEKDVEPYRIFGWFRGDDRLDDPPNYDDPRNYERLIQSAIDADRVKYGWALCKLLGWDLSMATDDSLEPDGEAMVDATTAHPDQRLEAAVMVKCPELLALLKRCLQ